MPQQPLKTVGSNTAKLRNAWAFPRAPYIATLANNGSSAAKSPGVLNIARLVLKSSRKSKYVLLGFVTTLAV